MFFPKNWGLDDRLACWTSMSIIGFVLFAAIWYNVTYRGLAPAFFLYYAFLVYLFGVQFFTIDYYFRRAIVAARWSALLVVSGFFLLLWGTSGFWIALYINWFMTDPAISAGLTSLTLGLFLFCGLFFRWLIPLSIKGWKNRKEAEA